MTFVHSFWSKPLLNEKFNKFETMLPIVLSNYAYSAVCIKKYGHKIKLYTDEKGAEILNFIDYDEVHILNNLENESTHFAAQIKFEALKNMSLNEYLIDGDLFLQRKPIFDILATTHADFLYSFYEPNEFVIKTTKKPEKYVEMTKTLLKYKDQFLPGYTVKTSLDSYAWPNTSLMKFESQELKDKYIRQYEYHKNLLKSESFEFWPDIIIEQQHMEMLLETGYKSRPLIYGFPAKATNDYACIIGFCHLGGEKVSLADLTYNWLQKESPDLYDKFIKQKEMLLQQAH